MLVLNGLGFAIKKIPRLSDWIIPFVLAIAGAVGHCAINSTWTGPQAIEGIAIGLAAVGTNQLLRQGAEAKKNGDTIIIKKDEVKP